MSGPPVIYFVRHGETDWNAEARLQGQRDIPLNPRGRVQAEEAGLRLRRLVGRVEDLDYVASPLGRTRDTMERLRGALGLDPSAYRLDDRLVELTFGDWEGLTGSPGYARIGGLRRPARRVLGSDIAGVVDEVGAGVTRFGIGDEVYGDNLSLMGGFAEQAIAAESSLAPKPVELGFAEASTIPQAGAIALRGTEGSQVAEGSSTALGEGQDPSPSSSPSGSVLTSRASTTLPSKTSCGWWARMR